MATSYIKQPNGKYSKFSSMPSYLTINILLDDVIEQCRIDKRIYPTEVYSRKEDLKWFVERTGINHLMELWKMNENRDERLFSTIDVTRISKFVHFPDEQCSICEFTRKHS